MPFWKKDKKTEIRSEPPAAYRTQERPKPTGEFADFRPDKQIPMKVWLPGPVDTALKQITDDSYQNRSDFIREILFIYVYGRLAFEQMKQQEDGLFYVEPIGSRPMFSRSSNRVPSLGKNSINYKVWLPAKLRDDLQALAAEAGITLSHSVREALISAVLGHLTLPVRVSALRQARETPDEWPLEEGEEE
jgi:hypothetical protein